MSHRNLGPGLTYRFLKSRQWLYRSDTCWTTGVRRVRDEWSLERCGRLDQLDQHLIPAVASVECDAFAMPCYQTACRPPHAWCLDGLIYNVGGGRVHGSDMDFVVSHDTELLDNGKISVLVFTSQLTRRTCLTMSVSRLHLNFDIIYTSRQLKDQSSDARQLLYIENIRSYWKFGIL